MSSFGAAAIDVGVGEASPHKGAGIGAVDTVKLNVMSGQNGGGQNSVSDF